MTTLLLAEHADGKLSDQTGKALSAALLMTGDVDVLVAGSDIAGVAAQAAAFGGVRKVLAASDPTLARQLAEPLAALIASLAADYDAVVAAATTLGKTVLPRVAALLDVAQMSEIVEVVAPDVFKRPIYAGNAIQTVQSTDPKRVVTVRTTAFRMATGGGDAVVEAIGALADAGPTTFLGDALAQSERPDLSSAKVVVSGGRALGSAEKFDKLILPLADKLGAAVGASRAAVDAGYAPNDRQIGQTGKVVAPDLYVACGISGAIQHLAGMKEAKVIVAINKDEDAPIFQIADYGLVADVFEAIPALTEAL